MSFLKHRNSGINITYAPDYALGWQFVQQARILLFEGLAPNFSIDFSTQQTIADVLYLVPPMHFHFISPSNKYRFWCIDIPDGLLDEADKSLLLAIKFQPQKYFALTNETHGLFIELLQQKEYDSHLLTAIIKSCFRQQSTTMGVVQNTDIHYTSLATSLLDLLKSRGKKLDQLAVDSLAEELSCSKRTLLRSCHKVFGLSTQEVLQYQMLLASLFMLSRKASIRAVAQELGFADQKSFIKFIKRQTNKTPKQVRATILGNQA
jgi:AraC-like DNA-binding protein